MALCGCSISICNKLHCCTFTTTLCGCKCQYVVHILTFTKLAAYSPSVVKSNFVSFWGYKFLCTPFGTSHALYTSSKRDASVTFSVMRCRAGVEYNYIERCHSLSIIRGGDSRPARCHPVLISDSPDGHKMCTRWHRLRLCSNGLHALMGV